MSRRFGRNRRRRAREALALSQSMLQAADSNASRISAALRNAQADLAERDAFIREVGEIVGRTAIIAGLPTKLNYKHHRARGDWSRTGPGENSLRIHVPQPMPSFEPSLNVQHTELSKVQDEILELLDIDLVADKMRPVIHARVTMADESVAYAISHAAIRRLTRGELQKRLALAIAEEMAAVLVDRLQRKFT